MPTELTAPAIDAPAALPLSIGWKAARANFWPGLFVQTLMLALVLAYYYVGAARPWFDALAQLKRHGGFLFSIVAAVVAGALVPEALKIVCFQHWKPHARNARELLLTVPYWGLSGFIIDLLYRLQADAFGSGNDWRTVAPKVLVDQFVYNPLFAAPTTIWAYEWKNRGFRRRGMADIFTARFYGARVVPMLLATWGVWIPMVTLIYALPPLLQTPLFALALTFWVMLVTYMTARRPVENVALTR